MTSSIIIVQELYSSLNKYVTDHNLMQLTFIYVINPLYHFILLYFEDTLMVYCIACVI